LNFRPHVNDFFAFISVPYTITDLQAPDFQLIKLRKKKISWNI